MHVFVVGTNDVHGSIERFPQLAGCATQGTLLSNHSEGRASGWTRDQCLASAASYARGRYVDAP